MAPTLSERIVACLLGLAKRIEAWAEAHPDAPLAEQEWAVLGLVRAALPALLEAVLLACTPGLSEPGLSARQPCPGCGKGRRPLGRRGRTVLTVWGGGREGGMVHYLDGWHEVKVGLVGGWDGERTVAQSYLASRSAAEAFGPLLLAEAARRGALDVVGRVGAVTRRGLYLLRSVVVLGDGAVWIWNLAADHFGERVEIVDFYHAAEHLWEVANAVYGTGSEAA